MIQATIFGDDIEAFADALERNGVYEFTNFSVKPMPAQYSSRAGDYQISFTSRTRIKPLDLSGCADGPTYRKLSLIPHAFCEDDELIGSLLNLLILYF